MMDSSDSEDEGDVKKTLNRLFGVTRSPIALKIPTKTVTFITVPTVVEPEPEPEPEPKHPYGSDEIEQKLLEALVSESEAYHKGKLLKEKSTKESLDDLFGKTTVPEALKVPEKYLEDSDDEGDDSEVAPTAAAADGDSDNDTDEDEEEEEFEDAEAYEDDEDANDTEKEEEVEDPDAIAIAEAEAAAKAEADAKAGDKANDAVPRIPDGAVVNYDLIEKLNQDTRKYIADRSNKISINKKLDVLRSFRFAVMQITEGGDESIKSFKFDKHGRISWFSKNVIFTRAEALDYIKERMDALKAQKGSK